MIEGYEHAVIDCPDPRALAGFSTQLLGMRVDRDEEIGATRLPHQGPDFRVYADPVGQPFCLCAA